MTSKTQPRVLIVEDQDPLRVLLFTLLCHQPLDVDTAASAEEALLRVAACDYAVIVVDLDLRQGQSDWFLRRFREQRPEATTFIFALRDPGRTSTLEPSLVSAVLNKPIELDTLADVVRETAAMIPPPLNPLRCGPAESDVLSRPDGDNSIPN